MQRKEYVKLVDDVRESGGEVKLFSSMHVSGERKLVKITKIDLVNLIYFVILTNQLNQFLINRFLGPGSTSRGSS